MSYFRIEITHLRLCIYNFLLFVLYIYNITFWTNKNRR